MKKLLVNIPFIVCKVLSKTNSRGKKLEAITLTIPRQVKKGKLLICPRGGIGRHKGLKIPRLWRASSSLAVGTIKKNALFLKKMHFRGLHFQRT